VLKRPAGRRKVVMITDPIADMLTRIRNGIRAHHEKVAIKPISKLKIAILDIMKREGFIAGYEITSRDRGGEAVVYLKYTEDGRSIITDLQRVSKPSRRVYVGKKEIPWVKNGLGIAILSTSQGLMTDREARRKGVGGELLLYIW